MAVEAAVDIHGNPFFDKVWEKRIPELDSKHRLRPKKLVEKAVDTIVTFKSDEGNDDRLDYCVITAAGTKDPMPQRPPILVSDRINTNPRISSRNYLEFLRRHTQGNVRETPSVINSQPQPLEQRRLRSDHGLCNSNPQYKQYEEDLNLYCCGRKVEGLIDRGTCMCCVKAALYHCTKDSDEEGIDLEHPCACETPSGGCILRWGCVALCSIIFPCMLCYLPLKGCTHIAEGYKKHRIISRRRRPHDET